MPKSFTTNGRPFVRVLLSIAALGLLAGCNSVTDYLPHGDSNASAIALGANPPKTAQPGANPSEKPIQRPVASIDINCPPVDVADDGAAYRVGGPDNASVRYQFNIGDTARQCDPAGPGQASLKIGVKGEVVVGPAGSAGTYSVPLKIVITREGDNKPVFSKTYKVEATTDGVAAGAFQIVTEPILVPMPTLQLADLYSVSVGFEGGSAAAAPKRHRRHPSG
ncbi:MAG TPA: hypothetical protein VJY34_26345 [Roseiarcus sp.]|nr:hypothetical protein [Roseiarcus sp.]